MRDNIINRYIQDLYRFFKLYSRRREFKSIFDTDINLTDVDCLKPFITQTPTLSVIAEFYFKNGFYDDAIKFYRLMVSNHDADPHVYQKIGYSFQSLGKWHEALRNYSMYELVDSSDVWNTKQMAQCYRSLHDHAKAIEYYSKALEISPQSVNLCLSLGHCFLDKGDYDKALQQYYKADLMEGAKHRAWRPIAWCSFLLSDYERAIDYYDRITQYDTPTPQDLLNRGHVLLCQGDMQEAITTYRKSLEGMNGDTAKFRAAFKGDAMELRLHGVSAVDQALIPDAVCGPLSQ